MDCSENEKRKTNPREKANILSLLTFWYTIPIFWKGLRRNLKDEDLYEVIDSCRSKSCGERSDSEWRNSMSIYKLYWRQFGTRFVILGLVNIIWGQITSILQPYGISRLISYFDKSQTNITKTDAYDSAAIVVVLMVSSFVFIHNFRLIEFNFSVKIQTSLKSLLYRKILRLSPESLSRANLGNIVTILTKDVYIIENCTWMVMDAINYAAKTLTVSYLLWATFGNSAFIGLGLVFLALPVQIYTSTFLTKMRLQVGKRSDERLQIMLETLSTIKVIKMFTWEKFFDKKIAHARSKELRDMMKAYFLIMTITAVGLLTSKLTYLVLILSYTWMGGVTTTELLFYTFSLFNDIGSCLGMIIPQNICWMAQFRASFIRLDSFLQSKELGKNKEEGLKSSTPTTTSNGADKASASNKNEVAKPLIEIENVFVEIAKKVILKDVKVNMNRPGLTIVSGAIGAGKSSILKILLGEIPLQQGLMTIQGTLSYASQEPWLFPGTLKQNILLGEKYEKGRYEEILRVCALTYDISLMENNDATIVLDRGLNLSKGQQHRINLARAIYRDSDIYLLDDPLAALDSSVQNFILKDAILEFLRDKICVMITQNVGHFKYADRIIMLKEGRVDFCGQAEEMDNSKIIRETASDRNTLQNMNESTVFQNGIDCTENKVYREDNKFGKVEFDVYKLYIKHGGGLPAIAFMGVLFILAQICECAFDIYVTQWIDLQQEVINVKVNSTINKIQYEETVSRKNTALALYTTTVVMHTIFSLAKNYAFLRFCRKASVNIHKAMSLKVITATMPFFDSHFIGNIINRFSHDLNVIDETIPLNALYLVEISLACVGEVIVIVTVNWLFLIPACIFLFAVVCLRGVYIPTGRILNRFQAAAKSPLVGHINSSLEGLTTIRAFRAKDIVKNQFDIYQDNYTSAQLTSIYTMLGFKFYMDFFSFLFTISIIGRFLFLDHDLSAGNVGLALTQVFILTSNIQRAITHWADVENNMTSVERSLDYAKIDTEEDTGHIIENWPKQGSVTYQNVTLKYGKSKEPVLKEINMLVKPGQKIGIVGRTGAGKSSILSTLFRLYDYEGKILIDDVDITTISLTYLRQSIVIIPQDPVLFSGTIRTNIDPYNKYSDDTIWSCLERVKVRSLIPSLDVRIEDNDLQFSVGQKQLICLARAAIYQQKIVVMDEATSNMDPETDRMLHEVIQELFSKCTMFTIAHRLHSVLSCDKVAVLDNGRIVEFDNPRTLLQNMQSLFYKMTLNAEL